MIDKTLKYYKKNGLYSTMQRITNRTMTPLVKKYYGILFRNKPIYVNPTSDELLLIEQELEELGIKIYDYYIDIDKYNEFLTLYKFPLDYHGGPDSGVWDEKILEHFVAVDLLKLEIYNKEEIYIDVAAGQSPWARMLNEKDINSYAIDLSAIPEEFRDLSYYRQMDARQTTFDNASINGMSLQCAYEMFAGNSDINLILESKRILKDGGKIVISPLYMHTHDCHYASPDFFGKGYGDVNSTEYIRWDVYGIYSSRKYSARKLKERVLDLITEQGMNYKIYILRNGDIIGNNIYMHFILEITK